MLILSFVPGAAFSALRAYVLGRSKLLASIVLGLSLAPVGANLVQYCYQLSGANFPPFGCLEMDDTTVALGLRFVFVIIARVPLIAADVVLIYITWAKLSSWDALKDIRRSKRLSLSDILFRGGMVLFVLNVLHLVLSVTALAGSGDSDQSLVTTFTAPLTAILISRFLVALQEANQMVVRLDPDDPLHSSRNPYDSTPSFISSLGGFINPNLPAPAEDDLELHVRSHSDEEEQDQAEASQAAASSSSA
ncbi:hypothetical protein C8T65DRAFT_644900 [Cerioporus squamosus]|nr:hypothetical protein C8T65DRAFT_644900 [Cerioporus squamosus]